MKDLNAKRCKHLTIEDRQEIMECLDKGMTFKAIGQRIGKDQTTISKEVKKHIEIFESTIKRMKSEGSPIENRGCPELLKAPFVCKACKKRRIQCSFQKQLYIAKKAHNEYSVLLKECREGIALNKDEFWKADAIIAAGMKKGQRLYHIMASSDVGFSKSTACRNLHRGYLSAAKMDFPRIVKFKARKQYRTDSVPKGLRVGRTYDDFLLYKDENNINSWAGMDTVIGRIGGKVIMTFDFTRENFMFGLLLESKTAQEAATKIRQLKGTLKKASVNLADVFPLLLTDNGGEFANVNSFTDDLSGTGETMLFFCDPYRSCQKAKVEKNHTLFRDIVPKGESFDSFTQDTVNLIFSRVNAIKRKSLNGKSPYEMFTFIFGEDIAALLGISFIPAHEVVQPPKLLAKNAVPSISAPSNTDVSIGLRKER